MFRLDGAAPRSQAEIARLVAAVWLTPQMDRLFMEGLSGRRRFLDRLVWALEPGHAREMAAHDTAVASRNRLLADGRQDRAWLAALEDAIARHAVAASAARLALVTRLNARAGGVVGCFPPARIGLACPIADRLRTEPALAVEDWLRAGAGGEPAARRGGRQHALGAHRTDMKLTDADTGTPAALASTGQQKALLIGVILAHAGADRRRPRASRRCCCSTNRRFIWTRTPRRAMGGAGSLPAQTFVTGTDGDIFLPLAERAEAFATAGGNLLPDDRFLRPEALVASVSGAP